MMAASGIDSSDRGGSTHPSVPVDTSVTQPPTSNRPDPSGDTSEQERLPLGQYLSRAREARHLSLDDLAHQTKIRRAILEALEHNARRDLPEKVFVLGYVRSYAAAVGLNVEEAVIRCNADWDVLDDKLPGEFSAASQRSWGWLWPALAAAGFGAGIWFIVHLR